MVSGRGARELLDEMQARARDRAAADPDPVGEVHGIDDEGVAFPAAPRITHVEMNVLSQARSPAVDGDDSRLVDHLVLDDDVAGTLQDAGAVAVDGGQDRADYTAGDAAVVVAVEFGGFVLAQEARAVLRLAPLARLASARAAGRPAGRRPATWRATASCRARASAAARCWPLRPVRTPSPAVRLLSFAICSRLAFSRRVELRVGQRRPIAVLRRPLERHTDEVVAREGPSQVGIAPRRLWRCV